MRKKEKKKVPERKRKKESEQAKEKDKGKEKEKDTVKTKDEMKGKPSEVIPAKAAPKPRAREKMKPTMQDKEEGHKTKAAKKSVPTETEDIMKMKVEIPELSEVGDLFPETVRQSQQNLASSSTATKTEVDNTEEVPTGNSEMETLRAKYERSKRWNAEAQEKMVEQHNYIEKQHRRLAKMQRKREEAEDSLDDMREWIAEWEEAKEKEEVGEGQHGEEGEIGCWVRKPRIQLVTANMSLLATVRELMVEYGVSTLQSMMPAVVKVEGLVERADGGMAFVPVLACRDCMRLKGDVARYPLPVQAIRHVQEFHGKGNVTSRATREVAECEW
jgi:hypothetical protein